MPRTAGRRNTRPQPRPITTDEFDAALQELLGEASPAELLAIPGMYELLSEAWNNEALERAAQNRET